MYDFMPRPSYLEMQVHLVSGAVFFELQSGHLVHLAVRLQH